MRKSNEYRAFAAHCLTFAKSSPDTVDKTRLLTMAAWLDLADRRTRVVKRPATKNSWPSAGPENPASV